MGMDWDPEGDADRARANRLKWITVIGVVIAIFAVVGNMIHKHLKEKERENMIRQLQNRDHRGY